jgi:tetratricopeptide (TPR) repeat protein
VKILSLHSFRTYVLRFLMLIILHSGLMISVAHAGEDPVFKYAKQQFEEGYYLAAISTVKGFIASNPNDAEALYLLAKCYTKMDNYVEADNIYAKVLKLKPKFYELYVDMGNTYKHQKRYDLAIEYYTIALNMQDTSTTLLNNRGMCFYYSDNFEQAVRDFNKVIKLDSTNYMAYNNRGSATYNNQNIATASKVDLKRAEKDFTKSIQYKPDFQLPYRNRGIVRYYLDSLQSGYKDLLYAVQLDPADANAHYYIGKILYAQNNFPVALQFFDNAIRLVNNKSDFFLDRGLSKLEMSNFSEAKEDFRMAALINGNNPLIFYHLARLSAAQEKMQDVIYYLRTAHKLGLFIDIRYFQYISKDKYFGCYQKDKVFNELIAELKWGKK